MSLFLLPFWLPKTCGNFPACLLGRHLISQSDCCCCCSPLRTNRKSKNNCSSRTTSLTIKSVFDASPSRFFPHLRTVFEETLRTESGTLGVWKYDINHRVFLPLSLCWCEKWRCALLVKRLKWRFFMFLKKKALCNFAQKCCKISKIVKYFYNLK